MTDQWWPCCACCDEGAFAERGRCVFNGQRDRHAGPCEFCEKACPCCDDIHPRPAVEVSVGTPSEMGWPR